MNFVIFFSNIKISRGSTTKWYSTSDVCVLHKYIKEAEVKM